MKRKPACTWFLANLLLLLMPTYKYKFENFQKAADFRNISHFVLPGLGSYALLKFTFHTTVYYYCVHCVSEKSFFFFLQDFQLICYLIL